MPVTKSAKKAMRSSLRKRMYNLRRKLKIKNALKELRRVLKTNPQEYQASLNKVYSSLDKAVKTGLIHRRAAARKKSNSVRLVRKALEAWTQTAQQ